MIKVEQSVVIKKPIEEVFAYSQAIENAAKWKTDVDSVVMEEGWDNTVGSRRGTFSFQAKITHSIDTISHYLEIHQKSNYRDYDNLSYLLKISLMIF